MNYILIGVTVVVVVVLLVACAPLLQRSTQSPANVAATASAVTVKAITPAEAKKRLESEQGIVVLDVRAAAEYAQGHIKGSVLLPVDNIVAEAQAKLPDKNAVLFVYCRTGRRSAIAAAALVKMGYTQVYNLGGIIDWPYEVVKN